MNSPKQNQRIVMVLGMHRSGTSLLANLLRVAGVDLGSRMVLPDANNPAGYWEQADIVQMQEEILRRLDRAWAGPKGAFPYPAQWWRRADIAPLKNELKAIVTAECSAAQRLWGFKDPRTARLLPLWKDICTELEIAPRYLLALRDPRAVSASIARRDGISTSRAELLWLLHMIEVLQQTRGELRMVVDYDRWFSDFDSQAEALLQALEIEPARRAETISAMHAAVATDLRHQRSGGELVLPHVGRVHELLARTSRAGELPAELWELGERVEQSVLLLQPWIDALEGERDGPEVVAKLQAPEIAPVYGLPLGSAPYERKLRVCIASDEVVGPVRNGGIGTAYSSLAEALTRDGHDVTLLFLGTFCENRTLEYWVSDYAARGIRFVPLPFEGPRPEGAQPLVLTHAAYRWLSQREYDVIHFPEWHGRGYYSLLAKRQGLAFHNTCICIGTHGPAAWTREGNEEYMHSVEELDMDFMERRCLELADVVVSPSAFMLDWMRARAWDLPARCYVQQNILPRDARRTEKSDADARHVTELVFFGRLEQRKGLSLFCDAMDHLAGHADESITVSFLGKNAMIYGESGESYVKYRAQRWPWQVRVHTEKGREAAMHYLRADGRLAVIPSLIENSPYTVLECLGAGVPFLASDVGGIPELIAAEDAERVCFPRDCKALAAKLRAVLSDGSRPARPARDFDCTEREWLQWHATQAEAPLQESHNRTDVTQPLVSVCVVHHDRPAYLRQALESLVAQDYPNFEVVLVDDGSTGPEACAFLEGLERAFQERDWQLVRQENRYLGAARNNAARHARGEYLLFMDDDNYAKPHEISTFVRAALSTGADILTSPMDVFQGTEAPRAARHRWLWLGGAPMVGVFRNCFGDANALVRKRAFHSVGGFTEDHGVGHEDWEFFARAVLMGFRLEVVPEALFWYRDNGDGMLHSTARFRNYMRSLRPYVDTMARPLRDLMGFSQGLKLSNDSLRHELARHHNAVVELRRALATSDSGNGNKSSRKGRKSERARGAERRVPAVPVPVPQPVASPPAPASTVEVDPDAYTRWTELHRLGEGDVRRYTEMVQSWPYPAMIHFVLELRPGDQGVLADTIDALGAQLLTNWRLTVVARSPAPDAMFAELDVLRWIQVAGEQDAAGALQQAVRDTMADWVVHLRAGDRFAPQYTLLLADQTHRQPDWQFLYVDEDVAGEDGARKPWFKPNFNLDLLRSTCYVGGACAVRRSALLELGGWCSRRGAEVYDLALRVFERYGAEAVGHLAELLFHAAPDRSGADTGRDEQHRQVLIEHLERQHLPAEVQHGVLPGSFLVEYRHEQRPLVSIIIPTRDRAALLQACVESLLQKTAYAPFELLIVDNASTETEALAYLDQVARDPRVRVLHYEQPFNYAAINNFAAQEARGEYLLLLNNDTVVIQQNWLDRMMALAQRPDVAIVGPRLIFMDQRLQHAGIVLGMGANGVAEHLHMGLPMKAPGAMGRAQLVQEFSAVTGACLLVRKSVYDLVAGMDEARLKILFNDVDFCLRVGALGHRIVWTPYATLVHHGSASVAMGAKDPKRLQIYRAEMQTMLERWLPRLASDPAYNRNLSLVHSDASPETEVTAKWEPRPHAHPCVLGMGFGSLGSWHYRLRVPLQAVDQQALAPSSWLPYYERRVRVPSVAELARLAPEVFLLHNTVHDVHIEAMQRYRKFNDAFLVFGQDDLMYALPPSNPFSKTVFKDMKRRLRTCLSLTDRLIVSTEPLAAAYRRYYQRYPGGAELSRARRLGGLPARRRQGMCPRVGWRVPCSTPVISRCCGKSCAPRRRKSNGCSSACVRRHCAPM